MSNSSNVAVGGLTSLLKSPIAMCGLVALGMGMFFLIGGMRTGIGQIVIPVSLTCSLIGFLASAVYGQVYLLTKRIETLEEALRKSERER